VGASLNGLVDLDEILYGGGDIEGDLDAIFFNLVALTIPKWRTFKHMRWMQNLHHEILYADTYSKGEKLSERQFL
jgi:hypothetical protein